MEKQPEQVAVETKTMHPVEQYRRNLKRMQNRKLASHLRRRVRNEENAGDAMKLIVLSIVFENTVPQGKLHAGLR